MLEETAPIVADAIKYLPWVIDGLDPRESENIATMIDFALLHFDIALQLVNDDWVVNGLSFKDLESISELGKIAEISPEGVHRIVRLRNLDAGGAFGPRILRQMHSLAADNLPLFDYLLQRPWVDDGLSSNEWATLGELAILSGEDAELAIRIAQLPFLETIDDGDATTITNLRKLAKVNSTLLETALNAPIVNYASVASVASLGADLGDILLGAGVGISGEEILTMPFLETIEPSDLTAIESMKRMARNRDLKTVMEHPAIQDGITDDEAKVVATLHGVMQHNPDLLGALLDPQTVILEERVIELPLAGTTLLTIIRTQPGSERSMDFLEHTVRSSEEFMGIPFPTNYVAYLFADATSNPTGRGSNFGTHIATKPFVDNVGMDYPSDRAAQHMAHEVGHYYWSGNLQKWVKEGGAEFLELVSEHRRIQRAMETGRTPCTAYSNIADLEKGNPKKGTDGYRCNYSLSLSFFLDMYHSLGPETFQEGFREFYANGHQGIEGFTEAFVGAAPEQKAMIDDVISRWYYGAVP